MATCAMCGGTFGERDVITFDGRTYCEPCKESPGFAALLSGGAAPATAPAGPAPKWPLWVGLGCLGACLVTGIGVAIAAGRVKQHVKTGLASVEEESCKEELEELFFAASAEKKEHGRYPTRIEDVRREDDDEPWGCPGVIMQDLMRDEKDIDRALRESYRGLEPGLGDEDAEPLAWDATPGNHRGRGRNVVFGDGTVHFMTEPEFQDMMRKHGK